jgi:hypothetical protein
MLHVEVRVRGVIDKSWSDWFDGLGVTEASPDQTTLRGDLSDQAALYGLLAKLRDLGFRLVSVQADEHAK